MFSCNSLCGADSTAWLLLLLLQIMESLGGDQLWFDRFLAEHAALLYFWVLILFYLFSPRLAYMFSELVELHAMDTYRVFVDTNESLLKELPPPLVAASYYRNADLYMVRGVQGGCLLQSNCPLL
jgi:ubiquinol oxidase